MATNGDRVLVWIILLLGCTLLALGAFTPYLMAVGVILGAFFIALGVYWLRSDRQ